jgi:hypothetical protein
MTVPAAIKPFWENHLLKLYAAIAERASDRLVKIALNPPLPREITCDASAK